MWAEARKRVRVEAMKPVACVACVACGVHPSKKTSESAVMKDEEHEGNEGNEENSEPCQGRRTWKILLKPKSMSFTSAASSSLRSMRFSSLRSLWLTPRLLHSSHHHTHTHHTHAHVRCSAIPAREHGSIMCLTNSVARGHADMERVMCT